MAYHEHLQSMCARVPSEPSTSHCVLSCVLLLFFRVFQFCIKCSGLSLRSLVRSGSHALCWVSRAHVAQGQGTVRGRASPISTLTVFDPRGVSSDVVLHKSPFGEAFMRMTAQPEHFGSNRNRKQRRCCTERNLAGLTETISLPARDQARCRVKRFLVSAERAMSTQFGTNGVDGQGHPRQPIDALVPPRASSVVGFGAAQSRAHAATPLGSMPHTLGPLAKWDSTLGYPGEGPRHNGARGPPNNLKLMTAHVTAWASGLRALPQLMAKQQGPVALCMQEHRLRSPGDISQARRQLRLSGWASAFAPACLGPK
jgi:hypothetical protein